MLLLGPLAKVLPCIKMAIRTQRTHRPPSQLIISGKALKSFGLVLMAIRGCKYKISKSGSSFYRIKKLRNCSAQVNIHISVVQVDLTMYTRTRTRTHSRARTRV